MALHAVITGDIVNSTMLHGRTEKKLMAVLHKILAPYQFEFYRGDSFQVYIKDAAQSLQVALLCRAIAISTPTLDEMASCDIRMSIGIGDVTTPVRKLASAKGEAFLVSGRAFDQLSVTDKRLVISTAVKGRKSVGYGLELVAAYMDSLFREITAKQAEVMYELLFGGSQRDAARKLKKSKSTISQMAGSAKWSEIEWILHMYENLIKEIK